MTNILLAFLQNDPASVPVPSVGQTAPPHPQPGQMYPANMPSGGQTDMAIPSSITFKPPGPPGTNFASPSKRRYLHSTTHGQSPQRASRNLMQGAALPGAVGMAANCGQSVPPSGYHKTTGQSVPPSGYQNTTGQSVPPSGYQNTTGQSVPPSGYQNITGQSVPPSGYQNTTGQSVPPSGYQNTTGQSVPPGMYQNTNVTGQYGQSVPPVGGKNAQCQNPMGGQYPQSCARQQWSSDRQTLSHHGSQESISSQLSPAMGPQQSMHMQHNPTMQPVMAPQHSSIVVQHAMSPHHNSQVQHVMDPQQICGTAGSQDLLPSTSQAHSISGQFTQTDCDITSPQFTSQLSSSSYEVPQLNSLPYQAPTMSVPRPLPSDGDRPSSRGSSNGSGHGDSTGSGQNQNVAHAGGKRMQVLPKEVSLHLF